MLRRRVSSALVFGPVLIAAVGAGGPLLALLLVAVTCLGMREYLALARAWEGRPVAWVCYLGGTLLVLGAWLGVPREDVVFLLALVVTFASLLTGSRGVRVPDLYLTLFGLVYLPWLISFILKARQLPQGLVLGWYLLAGTWLFDTLGYFVGLAWGRRRLCPEVSPQKSWEGALAGLGGSLAAAAVANRWLQWSTVGWVSLGLATGVAAQLGDLLESALKRHAGVKDSGDLIPGHGGVLDRFDSLLLVAPAVYFLAVLFGG